LTAEPATYNHHQRCYLTLHRRRFSTLEDLVQMH
jgi:hypothetical protein